jgi:hypothetical protein
VVAGRAEYRIGTVCKVLGISRSTLNGWINQGYAMGLSVPESTKGKFRPFTFDDIVRVAVFARFRDMGIDKEFANEAANNAYLASFGGLVSSYVDQSFFLVQTRPYQGEVKTTVVPAKSIGIGLDSDELTVVLPLSTLAKQLAADLDALALALEEVAA